MVKNTIKISYFYMAAAAMVVLDQVTKIIVKNTMELGEKIPLLGEFAILHYIENPGMAFGIRFGGRWFFAIFSFVAMIVLIVYLYRSRFGEKSLVYALTLILGGAVGNLIDRALYGRVVDFMDVDFFDIPAFEAMGYYFHGMTRWPVFNVADSCVSIGMVILIYYMWRYGEKKKPKQDVKDNEQTADPEGE
jgi:signal peptidase II